MNKLTDEQFEKKYIMYYKLLLKLAYNYTFDILDSEDIVQDVFVKYYKCKKTFENAAHEKNWLIRVTINQSIDFIKHKSKTKLLISNDYINNLPDTPDADTKNEDLTEYVNMLSYEYRTIIILFYYNNYSIKEISSILKISENHVKARLYRARVKLKELVGDKND